MRGTEPLIFKQYILNTMLAGMGQKRIGENRKYKGQLIEYFSACSDPKFRRRIENVPYDEKGLINLFTEYSRCTNQEIISTSDVKRFRNELQAVLGVRSTKLNFNVGRYGVFDAFKDLTFKPMYSPVIGIGFRSLSLKNSFFTSAMFTYSYLDVKSSIYLNPATSRDYQFKQKYHVPKLNLSAGISPFRKLGLYTQVSGFLAGLLESGPNGVMPNVIGNIGDDFQSQNITMGFGAGLAYNIKKFTLEAEFEVSEGISKYSGMSSKLKSLNFIVKYSLSKNADN